MAAWVKGGAADLDAAIRAAAELLGRARTPVLAGLCAETTAIRAAYRLAETLGASLDPAAGDSLYAELASLSTGSGMTTTGPEALGRADVVLMVGQHPWNGDLVADIAASKPVRGRTAGSDRTVFALGGGSRASAAHDSYGGNAALNVSLGHLRAFVRGHLEGADSLGELAGKLAAAQYGVAIYDPGELGELGVEMLQGLVTDLNDKTRFFTLSLADPYQGRSAQQLSAWTTGQAPRVGFGRDLPEHDPWRFDSVRQISAGEADAALWLASLPAPRPSWLGTLPSIALVGEGSPEASGDTAEVVIGVGVPGESVGGALWNARRGVVSYVEGKSSAEVTAADVLTRIRDHVIEGQA